MNITDVRVFLRNGNDSLKAYANITLDGAFAVKDLKVVEGSKGLFVAMPSRKQADGKYRDLAFPLTREARANLFDAVLGAYRRALEDARA